MSPLTTRPAPLQGALRDERRARAELPRPHRAGWLEPALVFATGYLLYAGVGIYLVLAKDLVVGDAHARLAHAYFVWWNEPSKLAAIGFYWPPLQTLVLLPGALLRPLAQSLTALPLTSALFGAGLLVVLDRAFTWAGIARTVRLAIIAAFALNPLYAFYAANGMGEIVYLYLLSLAVWVFLSWTRTPRWFDVLLIGTAIALGTLARYEVALYIVPLAIAILLVARRRRESAPQLESNALALSVPLVYGLLLWSYVNASIAGDALAFLRVGNPAPLPADPGFDNWPGLLADTLITQGAIFPLTFAVAVLLVAIGVHRRDPIALALAAVLFLNTLTTFALLLNAREGFLLELRYNMRSLPLTLLAAAWLLSLVAGRRRQQIAVAFAVLLVLTIPLTGWKMLNHDRELGARIATDVGRVRPGSRSSEFVRAMTGARRDEDGEANNAVDLAPERAMAAYIRRHIRSDNAILTDDSRTFGVILADGDPGRYLDRIDFGDSRWLEILRAPVGEVQYLLLVAPQNDLDRAVIEYPGIASGTPPPFLRLVHREGSYRLYRVVGT